MSEQETAKQATSSKQHMNEAHALRGRLIQAFAEMETIAVRILHAANEAAKIPSMFSQRLEKALQYLKSKPEFSEAAKCLASFIPFAEIRADLMHAPMSVHLTSDGKCTPILRFDPADQMLRPLPRQQRLFVKTHFKAIVIEAEKLTQKMSVLLATPKQN